jgi:hypothetical protein
MTYSIGSYISHNISTIAAVSPIIALASDNRSYVNYERITRVKYMCINGIA